MKINHVFIAGWLFFAHPALSAFTATTSAGRASARASKGGATVEEIEDLSREANVLSTNPRLDSQQSLHRASESNIPETPTTVSEPLPTPSMAIGAKDIKVDEKKSRKMAKSYQNARTDFAAKEILKVFKQVKKQQKPNLFNESSQSSLISRLNMFYAHIWKKFREWRLRKKIALILRKQPSWLQRWAQNVAIYHGVDFRSEESALDVKTQRELKNAASFIQKHQPELMATYKESDASKLLEKAQIYNTGAVENDSEYIGHFEIGRNNLSNQHQLDSQRSKKSQKMAKSYQKERIKFAAKEILEAFKKVEYTSPPSSFSFLNKLFRIWKKFTIDRRLRKKIEFLLAEQPSWLQIWAQDVAIYHGVDFRSAGLDLSINAAKKLKKAAMFIQKHQPELMATHKEIDGFKYLEKAQILNTGVARE